MSGATVPAPGQSGALPAPGQPGAPMTFEGRRWRPGLSFHIKRHALTDIGGELGEPAGPWRRAQGAGERRRFAVAGYAKHRAEYQPEPSADHRECPLARPVSAALRPALRPGPGLGHWLACRVAPGCARIPSAQRIPYARAAAQVRGLRVALAWLAADGARAVRWPSSSLMVA